MSAQIEWTVPARFACSNRLGKVGGSSAYPVTLAPSASSHNESQLPLKPVCPVRKTLRPRQNERLTIIDPSPPMSDRSAQKVGTCRLPAEDYNLHTATPPGTCCVNVGRDPRVGSGHRAFCSRHSASTSRTRGASTSLKESTASFDKSRRNTQPSESPIGRAAIARAAVALSMSP